ncbi:MAG: ArsR/SmtB family transcription factor [Pseudomonadota bacterium]
MMAADLIVTRLAALAHGTRLSLFRLLVVAGPDGLTVGRIAEQLPIPAATLSFHLKELSQAGLISGRPQGRFIHYAVNVAAMNELIGFLTENCCGGEPCGITPVGVSPGASSSKTGACCPPKTSTLEQETLP